MSRWSDYGFPHIGGVHIQTALEGLACAVEERYQAVTGNAEFPYDIRNPGAFPISDALRQIENSIIVTASSSSFVLPDGATFTEENAASYLGEELIELPRWPRTVGYDWDDPFPVIGYEWIMQRYRILNVMYRLKYTSIQEVLYGRTRLYSSATTIAGAIEEAYSLYEETTYYNYGTNGTYYAQVIIEENEYMPETFFSARQSIYLPKKYVYPLYVPAVLTMEGTVSAPSGGSFNSFGTGLAQGPAVVPVQLPADVEFGMEITFDTAAVVSNFRRTVPSGVGTTGFNFAYNFFADLRGGLEFYDPIEGV